MSLVVLRFVLVLRSSVGFTVPRGVSKRLKQDERDVGKVLSPGRYLERSRINIPGPLAPALATDSQCTQRKPEAERVLFEGFFSKVKIIFFLGIS